MVQSAFKGSVRLVGLLLLVATSGAAQTFDVNGQPPPTNQAPAKKRAKPPANNPASNSGTGTGMGWGASIEVAREARAAQTALQRGDAGDAALHAQRAVKAAPQNPDLWFTLAYAARLSGQYALSVDAYHRGLALRPSSIEGLSGLAQTYARMGKSAEAQETLQQVLAANPRSDLDLQLAGELLLTTDPKGAIDYLRRSEAVKNSPRTELLLARAYERTGDGDAAHRMLDKALRSAPTNPEVVRAVASYYRDTGHYDDAVHLLENLQAKDPGTLAELGYSYSLAGNARAAADSYALAASRAPREIEIQLNAAQAMLNAGDFEKAAAFLNQAKTINPEHYRLFALRGRLDASQRQYDSAIHEYEAALQHLPEGVPEGILYPISLRVDLAQIYRDAGDDANAARVNNDAVKEISAIDVTGPMRPEFLRLRASTEVAQDNVTAAEKDLKEALQIEPRNVILLLNYANLLWKTDRDEEARKTYQEAVAIDPSSAVALGALGYVSREMGDNEGARNYFLELEKKHPDDYVPYLALGDLYSATRQFDEAEQSYQQAFKLAPSNPLIVSGAMNAALEGHQLDRAKDWLARASEDERQNPQVMRENERYLTITRNYAESAELGYKVIQKLTSDREAVDYLAYDLLFLNRLDEAMKIVEQFQPVLKNDKDLYLIEGYVHADHGEKEAAVKDFTRALEIDPQMAVGYMNRGYVYNDLRLATKAEADFRKALALSPDLGEAHLGLAFALLQLRRSAAALKEAEAASRLLPESESLHLVKAEAFRQRAMLSRAENEYKLAIKLNPNTALTYIALADVEYRQHQFEKSADTLRSGLAVAPNDPMISAQLAKVYAKLRQPAQAMQAIETAERLGAKDYKILLVTADALRMLGHRNEAMSRYERALESSDENRLQVRLALGRLFAEEGRDGDAQQQIALGFAEARVAPTDVTSADDYLNAADILMGIHEYQLAQRMYGRAQALGADEAAVAVGMANASLALGDTRSAQLQLASLNDDPERKSNYEYLVAQANVYRQLGQNDRALANFVLASQIDPQDPATRATEVELQQEVGRPVIGRLGVASDVRVNAVFEDENIYQEDARLLGVQNNPALMPPPRRTIETFADSRFQFRPNSLFPIEGFIAERNAQGTLSFPSQLLIQNRDTFDTIFNVSVAPMLQVGGVKLNFMPGIQYTIRRDTLSPRFMNQNIFRQFVYVSSTSIENWLSFSGNLIREAGPFTEENLHSRDFSGAIDFRVGRPWSKNALLTGYSGRDLLFGPSVYEYYQTISYAGLQHSFGSRIQATAVAEFLRSWRVEGNNYALAQTLRPRFSIDARIKQHWLLSASSAWSSGRNFHAYDSVTSNVMASYTRDPNSGKVGSETGFFGYPMRFSFGLAQQTFYEFPGHGGTTQVIPAAQVTF